MSNKKIFRDRPSNGLEPNQIDKFKRAALELETDDSEKRFDAIVKEIAKPLPPKVREEKP